MNDMVMTEETALAVIPATRLPILLRADGAKDILDGLAQKARAFKADVSTEKGRAEIRSFAYEIAKSRTKLDGIGKDVGEDAKKTVDAINAERRLLRERLEELQEQVRAPLTAYENAEKDRIAGHETAIAAITALGMVPADWTAAQIAERLDELEGSPLLDRDWKEFLDRAQTAARVAMETLRNDHVAAIKRADDAWELARLRAEAADREREAAERAQVEWETAIAEQAAETARKAAVAEAARKAAEAEGAAQREREAAARREREQAEALDRAEREKEAAEERVRQAEAARIVQERRAEQDRQDAQRREEEAAAAATRREQARAAAEAAAAQRAADERARNVAHRGKINREALAGLLLIDGVTEVIGKAIVSAIAKGNVQHVSIGY